MVLIQRKYIVLFTARLYASAVLAVVVCLCVCVCVCMSVPLCLSVTNRSSAKTGHWIELSFGMEAFFHLSYTLCFKEIWVTPKVRVLPRVFVQNAGLRIFRLGGRSLQGCMLSINQ